MRAPIAGEHAAQTASLPNPGAASPCGETRNGLRAIDAVMRVARGLWPVKTAAELSAKSGASMRACEYWLARKHDMSADSLAALLRTEHGLNFLEAVMGDARPAWWRRYRRTLELAALRKAQAEQQRKLEQIEMEFAAD